MRRLIPIEWFALATVIVGIIMIAVVVPALAQSSSEFRYSLNSFPEESNSELLEGAIIEEGTPIYVWFDTPISGVLTFFLNDEPFKGRRTSATERGPRYDFVGTDIDLFAWPWIPSIGTHTVKAQQEGKTWTAVFSVVSQVGDPTPTPIVLPTAASTNTPIPRPTPVPSPQDAFQATAVALQETAVVHWATAVAAAVVPTPNNNIMFCEVLWFTIDFGTGQTWLELIQHPTTSGERILTREEYDKIVEASKLQWECIEPIGYTRP